MRKARSCFRFSDKERTRSSSPVWREHLKGLVVLERHCLGLWEQVDHSSERQEVLAILMEGKINMQKAVLEDFQRQIKELEEQKTKESLELVQRKYKLIKWEGERERARMLQRLESSRALGQWSGVHDNSWPSTQTKQCLLLLRWQKKRMRRCPNRLGLLWQK